MDTILNIQIGIRSYAKFVEGREFADCIWVAYNFLA